MLLKLTNTTILLVRCSNIRVAYILLMGVVVMALSGACDAAGGPRFRVFNDTGSRVIVYIDPVPPEYVDASGKLLREYPAFDARVRSIAPKDDIGSVLGYTEGLPLDTLLVITATGAGADIIYQETITLGELEGAVITIVME